jgi:hypothetical protein
MTPVHLDLTAYQSMDVLEAIASDVAPGEPATAGRSPRRTS